MLRLSTTIRCVSGFRRVCTPLTYQARFLSVESVFGKVDVTKIPDLPDLPACPLPRPSLQSLIDSGQSVLAEMDLFSWYLPTSYLRYALESIHMYADLPWWAAIITATFALRMLLIKVAISSQKLVAIQSKYQPQLTEFRGRMTEAQAEGNRLLVQQIMVEQNDFLKSKGIKMGRQLGVMLANGAVFTTQFFAIKKMADLKYPGFENGGTLWFPDLTIADPFYILPALSATSMAIVLKFGVDSGASSDQLTPAMKLGMQYVIPVVVLLSASQFASGICLYWCTSNVISLMFAGMFRITAIRNVLGIPPVVKNTVVQKRTIWAAWDEMKSRRNVPPSLDTLRREDAKQFKKAGRGKPIGKN